jgi:hypothetical protein
LAQPRRANAAPPTPEAAAQRNIFELLRRLDVAVGAVGGSEATLSHSTFAESRISAQLGLHLHGSIRALRAIAAQRVHAEQRLRVIRL